MTLPTRVRIMSQRIRVSEEPGLHVPCPGGEGGDDHEGHAHAAYGLYNERDQRIILDSHLPFERQRETFLHENLHAMLAIVQLDSLIENGSEGLAEHVVSTLAPVMLAWMRENPRTVEYLCEVQR